MYENLLVAGIRGEFFCRASLPFKYIQYLFLYKTSLIVHRQIVQQFIAFTLIYARMFYPMSKKKEILSQFRGTIRVLYSIIISL